MPPLTPWFILAQAVGLVAMAVDVYATTHKNDRRLLLLIAVACVPWAIHFLMLHAWAAAVSEIITVTRILVSLRWRSARISAVFIAFYVAAAALTAHSVVDTLPFVASIFGTYAMYHETGFRMRLFFLCGQALWLKYAFVHASVGGVLIYTALILGTARTGWKLFRENAIKADADPRT